MMTYATMTPEQIERVFAKDVLGVKPYKELISGMLYYHDGDGGVVYLKPLTDLNHAMLGVEKLDVHHICVDVKNPSVIVYYNKGRIGRGKGKLLQEAIVEACIRIKRPDLFEGE